MIKIKDERLKMKEVRRKTKYLNKTFEIYTGFKPCHKPDSIARLVLIFDL
jgi:hypothetical protein